MQLAFQRGRLIANQTGKFFEFGPNLEMIPNASAAYEREMEADPPNRDHIETAHRNFLRQAVFFLYTYNRQADAVAWFKYLAEKYPNKPILDGDPNSFPRNISLDDYAIGCINEELKDAGMDKTKGVLEGLERTAYLALIDDEDDRFIGLNRLCEKIWNHYQEKVGGSAQTQGRLPLPPLAHIKENVLNNLLEQLQPQMAAVLRTKLNLPSTGTIHKAAQAPTLSVLAPDPDSTNAPPSTNAVPK
jgi:hypothetical protein